MEFQNKFVHSSPLDEHLERLEKQAQALHLVRNDFFLKKAEQKNFESKLISEASGSSIAERQMKAQADSRWLEFHRTLAVLEVNYEHEKLKYSILDKSFMAAYLEMKINNEIIKRPGQS